MKSSMSDQNIKYYHKYDFKRIIKGPNYFPCDKQNIGSIPSKNDKIILQNGKIISINSFKHILDNKEQKPKIILEKKQLKKLFPISHFQKIENQIHSFNNIENKNKAKKIYVFGNETRFRNPEQEEEKYYPGPGEYTPKDPLKFPNKYFKSYKSIFINNNSKPLINNNYNNCDTNIGPGTYEIFHNDVNKLGTFSKLPKISFINTLNNSNTGPGSYELPNSFNIKRKNHLSHFFITCNSRNHFDDIYNLEKKFFPNSLSDDSIISYKSNNYNNDEINNFKSSDFKNYISYLKNKVIFTRYNINKIKCSENKEKQQDKNLRYNKEKCDYQRNLMNFAQVNNSFSNKGFTLSQSPKNDIFVNNHYPGPCYYNNDILKLKNKKSFHSQKYNNWY